MLIDCWTTQKLGWIEKKLRFVIFFIQKFLFSFFVERQDLAETGQYFHFCIKKCGYNGFQFITRPNTDIKSMQQD